MPPRTLPGRRVLVTGGAGFIGSHLTETLLEKGSAVTVIDDLSTGRRDNLRHLEGTPDFRLVVGSVSDRPLLDSLVRECDLIVHLAAAVGVELILEDPVRVIETNVLGSCAVLEAARRHARKILLTSTSEIYGKSEEAPLREGSDRLLGPTTNFRWSYSTSKAVDEYLALAHGRQTGLPVIVARLFNTIGPRQTGRYGMVVPRFIEQALADERLTVYGDGRQTRSFCDVRDVVEALLLLAAHPSAVGEVFNVGSPREVTILELARTILALAEPDSSSRARDERIRFVPYDEAYEPGFEDMRRRVPEVSKIRKLTGWEARRPLEITLAELLRNWSHESLAPAARCLSSS